jgi:hypothetical protein
MKKKLSKLLWNMVKQIIVVATTTAHKVLEEIDCLKTQHTHSFIGISQWLLCHWSRLFIYQG